jgi:hypothetical protein
MYWGAGPALGILSLLGYGVFVWGAALLWQRRCEVLVWANDEFRAARRSLIRHALSSTDHGLREELACKAVPTGFTRRLGRPSRRRIRRGAILLAIGPLLVLLDFWM